MRKPSYLQKNISLLRYLLGIWLLGSVSWMPFHKGDGVYYFVSQTAWIWLFGGFVLAVATFVASTFVAGFASLAPYRSWSFDKKFLRFFLIACLILLPFFAAMMVEFPPSDMISMIQASESPAP
jgi:ABC-type Fe3+ transport system permease subunit